MQKKRVLIVGPFPEPITGVSLANKVLFDQLNKDVNYKLKRVNTSFYDFEENLGMFSLKKVYFYLKIQCYAYRILFSDIIYITPGQTFWGVFKYVLFFFLAKMFNKKLIIHVHGNYIHKQYELLKGTKKKIFKFLLKQVDKGIVLSDLLRPNMSLFVGEENTFVVKNFVEDYLFEDFKTSFVEKKDNIKIVFLSNLMEEKGIFYLLKALKKLEEREIKYQAKIAGQISSENKDSILKIINELKHTQYCGIVKAKEKKGLLEKSNIFILPTFYKMEGQPISILESMATGNLILTTHHAGIPDVFEELKNGFYIDSKSSESIVEKMVYLKNNQKTIKDISDYNRQYAKQNFTINLFVKNIKDIFEV